MNDSQKQPTADDYKHYSQREHVLFAPEMYIGPIEPIPRKEYVFEDGFIQRREVTLPPGVVRIFMEVLTNASDNVRRSRRAGVNPGVIVINMDREYISIYNEGLSIPVVQKEEMGMLVPTMIFGKMNTSSSYNDNREDAARNGIGVKVVNIMSELMEVRANDTTNGISYMQTWTGNMSEEGEPILGQASEKNYTMVRFKLDFKHLNIPNGYEDEAFFLFMKLAIDVSFTSKILIYFNDVPLNFSSIKDYASLYTQDEVKSIVHYSWPKKADVSRESGGVEVSNDGLSIPDVEMIALDTPDHAFTISFVNGLITPDGGVHVDTALHAVTDPIVKDFNNKRQKSGDAETPKLTLKDVRSHVGIIVSVSVVNPQWNSQSKTSLRGPPVKINIPANRLSKVREWDLIQRLQYTIRAKQFKTLSKTDGSKRKFIGETKGDDANEAGGPHSEECTLAVMEGEAAGGYSVVLTRMWKGGRDRLGLLPLRGKLLNTVKADDLQIANNKEIMEMKKLLGLQEGVDYQDPENLKTLRYGRLMIMTDADDDGVHIKGLIMAYLNEFFPGLIISGFVVDYRTPYLRIKKGSTALKFFNKDEYTAWKNQHLEDWRKWSHEYFKGLGTSTKKEIKDDYNDLHIVTIVYDEDANYNIRKAFSDDFITERKAWLRNYQVKDFFSFQPEMTVTHFINEELIKYSLATLVRHIPILLDGMKTSWRKILFGTFSKWGRKTTGINKFNVARFASHTGEISCYHHGDSLSKVVIMMAQDFVGSNNLPYLVGLGGFGTRNLGGKEAAPPRYTHVLPSWWLPYVYKKEDDDILTRVEDQGELIEPEFYLPIIPIQAVNGANGIATGHSTFIPNHHPLDVIDWYLRRLKDEPTKNIKPWYRGFRGSIEIIDKRKVENETGVKIEDEATFDLPGATRDEEEVEGENPLPTVPEGRYSMVTDGIYYPGEKPTDPDFTITELPIGVWTKKYFKWVEQLQITKQIKNSRNNSNDIDIHIEISGVNLSRTPTKMAEKKTSKKKQTCKAVDITSLRLRRSYGMGNMILLDSERHPVRYKNIGEIMETFFNTRLPFYEKRRLNSISSHREDLKKIQGVIDFINAVITGKLIIYKDSKGRSTAEIYADMDRLGIDRSHLKNTSFKDITDEKIKKLMGRKEGIEAQINTLEKMTSRDIWFDDLVAFKEEYLKRYKNDRPKETVGEEDH